MDLDDLIGEYIQALERALSVIVESSERTDYAIHLSAAVEMKSAIANGDLGRASSIASEEKRSIGWAQLPGPGGDTAQELFGRVEKALMRMRLANAPDAGFEHRN